MNTNPATETKQTMSTMTMQDGAQIYYKDWGAGQAVVFSQGWPLSTDSGEAQILFLAGAGFRCIAPDRRDHDRSIQSWQGNDMDTYADDLAQLIEALDLKDAVLVGFSAGGGEVARYIGRHGRSRVAKVALIAAVVPLMLKTAADPDGLTPARFEEIRAASLTDRSKLHRNPASEPSCNADRPDAGIPQGVIGGFLHQDIRAGHQATCDCIKANSETDFTEDLKMFDLPTLIIDGEDDPLVPIAAAALLAATLVGNARLKIYPGAPQGLTGTHKDEVNADLLEFLRS